MADRVRSATIGHTQTSNRKCTTPLSDCFSGGHGGYDDYNTAVIAGNTCVCRSARLYV